MDARWLPILISPFIGSFAGVLIRRLPAGEAVAAGRSRCESCRHPLGACDLVPIISFLALRGRCRHCGAAIAPEHLAIELAAVAVAAGASLFDRGWPLWAGCVLGWALLTLAWIDWRHFWLPDLLTLPLIVAGLAATWLLDRPATADHAAAAIAAYAGLRGLAALYARLRHREGIGQGDAKLLAAGGAWLGLAALPPLLLLAALLGLAVAAIGRMLGHRIDAATALPFGPPLAAAIWLLWLWTRAQA